MNSNAFLLLRRFFRSLVPHSCRLTYHAFSRATGAARHHVCHMQPRSTRRGSAGPRAGRVGCYAELGGVDHGSVPFANLRLPVSTWNAYEPTQKPPNPSAAIAPRNMTSTRRAATPWRKMTNAAMSKHKVPARVCAKRRGAGAGCNRKPDFTAKSLLYTMSNGFQRGKAALHHSNAAKPTKIEADCATVPTIATSAISLP